MIIENPDAFKSWLTSILEPLCDADPAALAKYVYALVKKDKQLDDLRECMLDQLDVFLQHETKPFVEMLFKALETQEHLKYVDLKIPSPQEQQQQETELPGFEDKDNHAAVPQPPPPPLLESPEQQAPNGSSPTRQRVVMQRVTRPVPPTMLRPPMLEQTLVKVLPTELLEEPLDQLPRRRERRADSLRDKDDRRRRRSRSWERKVRSRRARDPHEDGRRYERRRPSRSPSPRGRYRNRSSPSAVIDKQNSKSRSRSPVPVSVRDREHERERDRLRVPREIERDRMSRDRDHRERLSRSNDRERSRDRSRERSRERSRGSASPRDMRQELSDAYKRRCRDFDEKGYCMRGDLCQWDHGADPLVLEDATLTSVLSAPPPEYNPLSPDIWCGAPTFAPPFGPPRLPAPRELIPIPRVMQEPPGMTPMPMYRPAMPHKKNFDYNQGHPRPPQPLNAANSSLEVKKVPRGLNDITHLNNHFSKFGKIVNIQVCLEGDPEAALVTFSSPVEASVAYKSTEAVLNNRFIKVFWHTAHEPKPEVAQPPQHKPNDKQAHPMSHNKVLINRDNIKATSDNRQLQKIKELANGQEPKEAPPAIKPVDKSKQVMEMTKRAQSLLETQLQQQMLLIEKLENGSNMTANQKTAVLDAINSAQEGIEKLRKELFAYNSTLKQMQANAAKRPRTRQETEKEILDVELDMFTKQQEGQDVTELLKKIGEMRRALAIQFPTHPGMRRPHSRGGGRYNTNRYVRGGAQKSFSVNQSVDHRPRSLLISGFESDELGALVQHFSQFGEISHKEVRPAVPELVLQFAQRAHAEQAAARGKHYNDRTLTITWVPNTKSIAPNSAAAPRPLQTADGDKEPEVAQEKAAEDALLRFDEEEEDDAEEDRSWRR